MNDAARHPNRACQAEAGDFRTCRQTPPEDCRKSRISIDREDTTAPARISTITTDRNTVTRRYFLIGAEIDQYRYCRAALRAGGKMIRKGLSKP